MTHPQSKLIRTLVRTLLVLLAIVLTLPLWGLCWLEAWLTRGESIFTGCSEFLSLIPGRTGIFLRRGFYRMTLHALALDCQIGFGTTVAHRQVSIGRSVYIGNRCMLGKVIIDDHATIGSHVNILSGRHQHHFDQLDVPVQDQGGSFTQLHIGRNSWIGNCSVVMADLGEDCVIGAGSVVVKPIPPRTVAVGNPATVKKRRSTAQRETPARVEMACSGS